MAEESQISRGGAARSPQSDKPGMPAKINWPAAVAWAFYDFANTIYSAIVITVYLPLHMHYLLGRDAPLGITATASMILSGFAVPFLGALSDRTGRTKRYLIVSTLACVSLIACLSLFKSPLSLLVCFALANLLFHAALVFYNSLLPVIASPERQGFISGLGTGLGYLGVFAALPAAHMMDTHFGRRWVFLLAAILFLIFSLPLFFRVPERPSGTGVLEKKGLRAVFKNRAFLLFAAGNFFLLDALNASILWFSVFLSKSFGIPQGVLVQTLLALNASAFLWGLVLGKATDRFGAKTIFLLAGTSLGVCLAGLGTAHAFKTALFFILGFGGLAAAGLWTAGRKLVIELADPARVGAYFGIYGLSTKISAVGSTTFSLMADFFGYRAAVLSLLVSVAAGLALIARLRVPAPKTQSA